MNKKVSSLITALVLLGFTAIGAHAQTDYPSSTTVSVSTLAVFPQPTKSVVTNLWPDNGSFVTTDPPYIMVKHGQRIGQLQMFVDGINVSNSALLEDDKASYSPPSFFSLGDHTVQLIGTTMSGSAFRKHLKFTVQAQGPAVDLTGAASLPTVVATVLPPYETQTVASQSTTYAMGAPSSGNTMTTTTVYSTPLVARTLTISPLSTIKVLDNVTSSVNGGEDIPITLLGRPNGIATFDLIQKNGASPSLTGLAMTEISPGVYSANFHVTDAGLFNNSNLVGHLSLPTGEMLMASTPTVNDRSFYAMYVGNPLYATVWIPNIAAIGEPTQIVTTTQTTTPSTMGAPSNY